MMKTWLRLLLVLTAVGGGCTGVLATLQLFSYLPDHGPRYALVVLIAFTIYSFLTIAGLLFVYDVNLIRPMLVAFVLLVPWVDLPGLRYQMYSLLYSAVSFGPPNGNGRIGTYIEWSANFGTHADLRIGGLPEDTWSAGVNLFALLITVFLLMYGRKIGKKQIRLKAQYP